MTVILKIGIAIMGCVYAFMKLRPTRDRVVFISRQGDEPSLDIDLLMRGLRRRSPRTRVDALTRTMGKGRRKLAYAFHLLRQMEALSTSRVAVLDSYCIPVSVLRHKDDLTVIQMWHAIGVMKNTGLGILGKGEGRSARLAALMRMHRGYDLILVSAERCRRPLAEVFGYPVSSMAVRPLPRVDVLRDAAYAEARRLEILSRYPELGERENILYIPTFRVEEDGLQAKLDELIGAIDPGRYNLIVKPHPLSRLEVRGGRALTDDLFSSLDMLFAADYVVTDYSAMIFEALLAGKPVYFYAFDIDRYGEERGWLLDYRAEIPGEILHTGDEVARAVEGGGFDETAAAAFLGRYVETPAGSCTERICDIILEAG
jgi:CDP-ribitol ribitolphosphotransferase